MQKNNKTCFVDDMDLRFYMSMCVAALKLANSLHAIQETLHRCNVSSIYVTQRGNFQCCKMAKIQRLTQMVRFGLGAKSKRVQVGEKELLHPTGAAVVGALL